MTNKDRVREIVICRKQMKKLTREFMLANDISVADTKLDELSTLATKVAILKQEQRENGFIAKLKKKIGL